MDPRLVDTSHNVWSHYKRPFCQMKFIYINNYTFYRYYKQNDFCLQFNALFFLSFILEHAKALYKLWLVLINSKGSDIILPLEITKICHKNIVTDTSLWP